jgi:hypothetical protein
LIELLFCVFRRLMEVMNTVEVKLYEVIASR